MEMSRQESDVRTEILKFFKEYYTKNKKAPSIRDVEKKLRSRGVTRVTFYGIFPGGLREACKAASVPAPERLKQTKEALKTKKESVEKTTFTRGDQPSSFRITLTEEQTKRLLAISHLESGLDPSLIIDRLLDNDSKMRKTYELNFAKVKRVSDFLDAAVERKWQTDSSPNIVGFLIDLWNAGCMSYSSQQIAAVTGFLVGMKNLGWKTEEITEYLTKLSVCGVQNLPLETVKGMIELADELNKCKWQIGQFVEEATKWHNTIYWFRQYKKGLVSAEEARQKVMYYS